MIKFKIGDIFSVDCESLVVPVNTFGVMGAGLAKAFKVRYPGNFIAYNKLCSSGGLMIGEIFCYEEDGKTIINFPTKTFWVRPSQYIYIYYGLVSLRSYLESSGVSVCIPAIGCGLGGLHWPWIRLMIEAVLDGLDNKIIVLEPN